MKITLKEFKELVGKDKEMNEGFMDFFRKKDKSVEAPEVEPVEDVKKYMRLYRELFTFAKDVNVGKKDLAFLEQIKRELNRIKFSPINKKSSITSNAVQKIRTQYLPMLLQSLMNNHNKEFNRYVDKDFINSFEIEVPTVRYSSSDVSPKELYFVADEMLKFAVKQDYKDVYIRKLNSLLQKAKEFKNLYEKSPDDFGAYYQEFNSLVIELKKMLTTWRNKFNVNYNMLPTGVKYFALNETTIKESSVKIGNNFLELTDYWQKKVDSLLFKIDELESNKNLNNEVKEKKLANLKTSYKEAVEILTDIRKRFDEYLKNRSKQIR